MRFVVQLGFTALLLLVTYFVGAYLERRHLTSIRQREQRYAAHPHTTLSRVPESVNVTNATLVTGSVVVSLDYFKRFLATLRGIVGGRIRAYEPLLDRARREALLRMREAAMQRGFDAVINVRLETSRLASGGPDGRRTAGIEILAFGTALRYSPQPH